MRAVMIYFHSKIIQFKFLYVFSSRTIRCSDGCANQMPSRFVRTRELESCRGELLMGKNIVGRGRVGNMASRTTIKDDCTRF